MTTYLVTYDLHNPGRDYSRLHEGIRSLDRNVWHGLESVWILNSGQTAGQIRTYLEQFVDTNDSLFVVGTAPTWSAKNVRDAAQLHPVMGTVPVAA